MADDESMSVDPTPSRPERQPSPMLPPSPVSIPSSPSRKRPRTEWNAPPHIPDFLPPFPVPNEHPDPPSPENTPATLPTLLRTQERSHRYPRFPPRPHPPITLHLYHIRHQVYHLHLCGICLNPQHLSTSPLNRPALRHHKYSRRC
jgi:hypothetical protein